MRSLLACWRLLRVALHLLQGLAVAGLLMGRLGEAARARRIQRWSAKFLRLMGVGLLARGSFTPGASLIVANHVSWLDIIAIHSVHPRTRFVSKADVKHWPIVGMLVRAGGTLFIERERKRDAMRVVHQMAQALSAGASIGVFPEGTTGEGAQLLPFHANLLQAAIATDTNVQPVALRYADAKHRFSEAVSYVGETSIALSLWRIAMAHNLHVHLNALPPLRVTHTERRALSERLRQLIAAELEP